MFFWLKNDALQMSSYCFRTISYEIHSQCFLFHAAFQFQCLVISGAYLKNASLLLYKVGGISTHPVKIYNPFQYFSALRHLHIDVFVCRRSTSTSFSSNFSFASCLRDFSSCEMCQYDEYFVRNTSIPPRP